MKLFHYTSGNALRPISKLGITVGDVPTGLFTGRVGVWFTTLEAPGGHGLEGSALDKRRFRIEVASEDLGHGLHRWVDWAEQNASSEIVEKLHRVAQNFETWYVYFGWVQPHQIREVIDTSSGLRVENWGACWPEDQDVKGVPHWYRARWHKATTKQVNREIGRRLPI